MAAVGRGGDHVGGSEKIAGNVGGWKKIIVQEELGKYESIITAKTIKVK